MDYYYFFFGSYFSLNPAEISGTLCLAHLHLSLFSVVVAPQHHLAVLPSSRHQGAVLQDTNGEDPALVGPRHLMADAVTTCQSRTRTEDTLSLMDPFIVSVKME